MISTVYVLDTNVFVEAARRYYSFDLLPTFWDKLVYLAKDGQIISIDRVKKEIDKGDKDTDKLLSWANNKFQNWFVPTAQPEVIDAYREIINWVESQDQFLPKAKKEFATAADGWLVAYAKVHGYTVVTQEKYEPQVRKEVKIPNVCLAFDIPYVDTFKMLRQLKVTLS